MWILNLANCYSALNEILNNEYVRNKVFKIYENTKGHTCCCRRFDRCSDNCFCRRLDGSRLYRCYLCWCFAWMRLVRRRSMRPFLPFVSIIWSCYWRTRPRAWWCSIRPWALMVHSRRRRWWWRSTRRRRTAFFMTSVTWSEQNNGVKRIS